MKFMKPEVAYDFLMEHKGIKDPAVLVLSGEHIVGRWVEVAEVLPASPTMGEKFQRARQQSDFICRVGKVAIQVFGRGPTLQEAMDAALARLSDIKAPPKRGPKREENHEAASEGSVSGVRDGDGSERTRLSVMPEALNNE